MNNTQIHSYKNRVTIPRTRIEEKTKGDGLTIVGLFAFIVLVTVALIVFGPSIVAVSLAALTG